MKNHRICILGGTGFVGRHLVGRLAKEGHHIKVLTRHRERHKELLVLPTVQMVDADVQDIETLNREFKGMDVVINLVGILNEKGNTGKGFYRVHVELPRKIVDACRLNRIHRLLHMSANGADAAYGLSHYQRSKGEGENLVHGAHDIDVTSFRPSVVFGPGDSFLNRFGKLLRISPYFFPLACPNTRFAPVYVGDVVEAYARALDNHACFGQRYELCGPNVYTLRELVAYTAHVLGLKRKIIPLGHTLSKLQAEVLEFAPGKPFSRDNYLSLQKDNVCEHGFPDVFGIKPTPLESVAPVYMKRRSQRARLDGFRRALDLP